MARLNETDQPSEERPRFSLLPDEAAEDAVVCTLDWLKEAVQTPKGLEQAYTYITATINERDRLLEQIQTQNQAHETQVMELINERDELN
jgi:hypothetical protein